MDITISKSGKSEEKGLDLQLKEKIFVEEVKKAKQLIDGIELPTDLKDGLSFLDMKNDTMLSYLIDLMNIVLKKANGEKIEGHESIERICEYRLTLEKSKAIDQKLKYQLNRLLTARDTNERMNLDDFDMDGQDDEIDPDNERKPKSSKRKQRDYEEDEEEEVNEDGYEGSEQKETDEDDEQDFEEDSGSNEEDIIDTDSEIQSDNETD